MTTFRVWAPEAERVELVLADERVEMEAGLGGWWCVDRPDRGAATRYRFAIDGGPALPDPRSASQPDGVHGPSELVDHGAFSWSDGDWGGLQWPPNAIYEIHVGTFTLAGTFEAAIERLDHLVALGVDAVELMPVAAFPGDRGWGYDGVDLYAPLAAYGGPEGLKRLVDACHARGLGAILDVVYNHLGPDGNYLAQFGPYMTDKYRTPWGEAVNLDETGADEVRRFFVDNALMWLRDYHIDGLRIDSADAFFDQSALHVLEQLQIEVDELAAERGFPLHVVAENDLNDPRYVRSRAAGGYGHAAMWSNDLHHALHALLTGERQGYYADYGAIADVAKALREAFVLDGRYSQYRGRRVGRPASGLSGHRFVCYLQNHDQAGNRARGSRITPLCSLARHRIGATLTLLSPFVPLLFMGEEWGGSTPFPFFTDHRAPGLGESVRRGRRQEFAGFGWRPEQIPDPQALATFEAARLDWDERERAPHAEMLGWYQRLLALRQAEPALADGRLEAVEVAFDETEGWLTMRRGPIGVAVNLASEERAIAWASERSARVLMASDPALEGTVLERTVRVPPDGVVILEW